MQPTNSTGKDLLKIFGWLTISMGILFIISAIAMFPAIGLMSKTFKKPYENYNFQEIDKNGSISKGVVLDIRVMTNVEVNGDHPMRIIYEYGDSTNRKTDTFQTFELEKVVQWNPGDTVDVKSYNGESVIHNVKPFSFPYKLFYILPIIFLGLGIAFIPVGIFMIRKSKK